jgi:hypothetical protein
VQGPFKNEQDFKRAVIKVWEKSNPQCTCFALETEETEPGMPDVLTINPLALPRFTEFKYADKNGVIEFRKSQPLFYRKHQDLLIQILAWDPRMGGRVVRLDALEVIAAKSLRIALPMEGDK